MARDHRAGEEVEPHGGDGNDNIFVGSPSTLHAGDTIDGGSGNSDWLYFNTYNPAPVEYDLTSVTVENIEYLYFATNAVLDVDTNSLSGFRSIYGGWYSGSALRTSASTLDLSNIVYDQLPIESTNASGTTFTVSDAATAANIIGGPGSDTIVANGFAFTADQRAAIFAAASIEKIVDGNGTYYADHTTQPNNPPSLSGVAATASFTEEAAAITLSPSVKISDLDGLSLASATISITGGTFAGDGDVLAATTTGTGITASYDASNEVLTLTGLDTLAHYQSVLNSITFGSGSNAGNYGANLTRTVSWVLNDGATSNNLSAPVTSNITIVRHNKPPSATIEVAALVATAHQNLSLKNADMRVSDPDALGAVEIATLSVSEGTLSVTPGTSGATVSNSGTSAVTITGTLAQINALLNNDSSSAVSYLDDSSNLTASATFTLGIDDNGNSGDGGSLTAIATAILKITAAAQTTNNNLDGTSTKHVWDVQNNSPWSDYIVTYGTQGETQSQTTNYHDGSHTIEIWDALNQNSWLDYIWSYDAQGRTTEQTVHYRDATYTAQYWDVSNQNTWSNWTGYYDNQDHETKHFVKKDDGTYTAQYWDVLNQNTWSDWAGYYDDQNRETVHFVDNHDGTHTAQYFDVQNQNTWASWVGYYDNQNRETTHFVNNHDGTRTAQYFDVQGQNTWKDFVYAYDNQDRLTSQTIDYRDGHHTVQMYDVAGMQNWSSVLTSYDANWQQQSQTFMYRAPPVVLDLDGNGIDITPLSASIASFDMSGSGERSPTAWVGGHDGLLAIDLSADGPAGPDGVIDQAKEINFTLWAPATTSDLQALRQVFDTDHDGKLDPADARWNEFRVWTDASGNGVSEPGELQTLADRGITSIDLNPSPSSTAFPDGSAVQGLSSFTRSDGSTALVGDVAFAYAISSPGMLADDGTHVGNLALLGSYMASAFVTAGNGHDATLRSLAGLQPKYALGSA